MPGARCTRSLVPARWLKQSDWIAVAAALAAHRHFCGCDHAMTPTGDKPFLWQSSSSHGVFGQTRR